MSGWPAAIGSGESVFVSERSAAGSTVVPALAELSALLGSATSEVTLASFVIEPSLCGRTLMSTVAPWPLVIVPSGHVTVPLDSEQVPCEGVAESKVTPAGRVSETCTPVALEGPWLLTVSV